MRTGTLYTTDPLSTTGAAVPAPVVFGDPDVQPRRGPTVGRAAALLLAVLVVAVLIAVAF